MDLYDLICTYLDELDKYGGKNWIRVRLIGEFRIGKLRQFYGSTEIHIYPEYITKAKYGRPGHDVIEHNEGTLYASDPEFFERFANIIKYEDYF